LGYVVNVIENPSERADTLRRAFELSKQLLIVAARLEFDRGSSNDILFGDGCLTARNTFQKYFTQLELRQWVEETLGTSAVAASPGVFYVFRDDSLREQFLATRHRRPRAAPKIRKSDAAFEAHKTLLDPLMEFVVEHGRVPEPDELSTA